MASAANRFSTLQKVAIFLICLGQEKAREILDGVDAVALQRLNATIEELGDVTAKERAAVMIEFGDFFYKGKELLPTTKPKKGTKPARKAVKKPKQKTKSATKLAETTEAGKAPADPNSEWIDSTVADSELAKSKSEEKIVISALKKLREKVDPRKIDWSRAGYDFGEGFKGPPEEPR